MIISQYVIEVLSGHDFCTKISKEHNSVKNVGGVTVLLLSISHDGALYLYQVS